jgi:peptidoglycan/LPS O-acetylase OafA/YrhL
LVEPDTHSPGDRFLASGDESGTAPEDRPFRPDVEGLRALAVALVVLFHSGVSALSGGYIGVDVFFVISGFVITGVLLRERIATGRTSILAFYGRRCRRIIPAATLVIIVTVLLSYVFLGVGVGGRTATDGRFATVFLANFHFSAIGTNYLSSQAPPSPLQNYWSLSVEEQFYVVYPTLFLLLAGLRTRWSLRGRLAAGLVAVIAVSLAFSVLDTSSHPTSAYFSPFTRAWELGLGALVAVGTPWLKKTVPSTLAALATWLGLGAILVGAFAFGAQTAYPGSLVAIPVAGAALIIAGGVNAGRFGVEALLGLAPMRLLGKLSYSLYLWHWPLLIVAAEYAGKTSLSLKDNLGWDLVALGASALTYVLIENPVRHAKSLFRVRWVSVGLGAALIVVALGAVTLQSDIALANSPDSPDAAGAPSTPPATSAPGGTDASLATVLSLVAASAQINTVPPDLVPPFAQVVSQPMSDLGFPAFATGCWPSASTSTVPACVFGDRSATNTMVLYGDSHAAMWFQALDDVATAAHWKLVVLAKSACPAEPVATEAPGVGGDWAACDTWHSFAIKRINEIDPNLLIVSEASNYDTPSGVFYTRGQWQDGLEKLFKTVTAPKAVKLVLGNIPSSKGADCLTAHTADVQACSSSPHSPLSPYNNAEKRAAVAEGARYIDVTPWFCAKTCSVVIGNYDVYLSGSHVAVGYSRYLEGALSDALDLSTFGRAAPPH